LCFVLFFWFLFFCMQDLSCSYGFSKYCRYGPLPDVITCCWSELGCLLGGILLYFPIVLFLSYDFFYSPWLLLHGLKLLHNYIMQVHLVGGFEDVSPNVWLGFSTLLLIFQRCSFPLRVRITEVECVEFSMQYANSRTRSKSGAKLEGYSYPLCAKIVESMCIRQEKFHVRTFFVLGHNTRRDSEGNAYPIFNGLAVRLNFMVLIYYCLCWVHLNWL